MTKDEAQRRRWTFYEAVNLDYPTSCNADNTFFSPVAETMPPLRDPLKL